MELIGIPVGGGVYGPWLSLLFNYLKHSFFEFELSYAIT